MNKLFRWYSKELGMSKPVSLEQVLYRKEPLVLDFKDASVGDRELSGLSESMQYIGMKDKKKEKIFERDLVRIYGLIAEVKWSNHFGGWILFDKDKPKYLQILPIGSTNIKTEELEIVSNYYENKNK